MKTKTKTFLWHLKTKTKKTKTKTKTKTDSVDHHALLEDQYGGSRCPFGGVLYSIANDSQPQMIPRPQMIPKMDRKWSSTASDPESRPQMIPWKLEEWNGFYGTDDKKGLIIKKETLFSRLLNKDGRRPGRYISGQFIQGEKKNGINLKRYHGINRKLLPLSIASIFFQECFVFWKIQDRQDVTQKKLYYFNA